MWLDANQPAEIECQQEKGRHKKGVLSQFDICAEVKDPTSTISHKLRAANVAT